jgi:uncharacterized membrane protein YebE (DUF533 family)
MFDAKSILDNIVQSAAQSPQQSGGSLGETLNTILKSRGPAQSGTPGSGGGLADILGEISRSLAQQQGGAGSAQNSAAPPQGGNPNIGDVLAQLRDKLNQAGGSVTDGGSIADILGKVLSQATQGVKEGATRAGEAMGAGDVLGRIAASPTTDDLLAKLRAFVEDSPLAAGAAAGGLGGLILGNQTGRAIAAGAVRIGALAMIGGLAYKAVQNYQAGKPLITGATATEAAPAGSGFEPAAVTNDAAIHYIQAMIAAAAADRRIDPVEHDKIIGSLKQAGLDGEAEAFLAKELNSPRSVQDLAGTVKSPQEAIQLYAAARIAVADDSPAERQFLSSLATALGIDAKLAAHVDATARSAAG